MKSQPPFCVLSLVAALFLPAVLRAEPSAPPTYEQVRQILQERIEKDKRGVAIVVGLIDAKGSRVVAFGNRIKDGGVPVDGKTIFEVGSVTKVFTSLLLADMVARGEVKLDDPVAKYLPKDVKVPTRGGREITLLDLATHRSGLPSVPDNLPSKDDADPWADYTTAQLYEFLSGYELKREIGSQFEYSNLGVGLLGNALARRETKASESTGPDADYALNVFDWILQPLGMADTGINPPEAMHERLATPYGRDLRAVKPWHLPALAGAGSLRSDVDDLLKFVSAELGLTKTPLAAAMQETQKARNKTDEEVMEIGLGWLIMKRYDPPVYWHNGGTGGFRSFVGFCPAKKIGVVVLSNSAFGVDDIGFHLLDDRFELKPPLKERTAIQLKPETADQYLGKYEVIPQFALTFSREGDRYFIDATDNPRDEVFPETENQFFSKSFDGQIEFVKDADGRYSSLILHQGGLPDQSAKRLP